MHSKPGAEAQAYNSSYFGGRDQEDHGRRPALAKKVECKSRPYLKNNQHEKSWLITCLASGSSEFNPIANKIKKMRCPLYREILLIKIEGLHKTYIYF
jgi:hypothetical protein